MLTNENNQQRYDLSEIFFKKRDDNHSIKNSNILSLCNNSKSLLLIILINIFIQTVKTSKDNINYDKKDPIEYDQVDSENKNKLYRNLDSTPENFKIEDITEVLYTYSKYSQLTNSVKMTNTTTNENSNNKGDKVDIISNYNLNETYLEGTYNNYDIKLIPNVLELKKTEASELPIVYYGAEMYQNGAVSSIKLNSEEETSIFFNTQNTQYGTSLPIIKSIYYNKNIMDPKRDYYLNYSLAEDSYYSDYFDSSYNNTIEYKAYCKSQATKTSTSGKYYNYLFYQQKPFRVNSFGLKENTKGVFYISYNSEKKLFEYYSLDRILNHTAASISVNDYEYKEIWVIDEPYSNYPYLVLLTKNYDRLFFLKLYTDSYGNLISLEREFELDPQYNLMNSKEVHSVSKFRDYILVGSDLGLFVMKKYEGGTLNYNLNSYSSTRQAEISSYLTSFYFKNFGLEIVNQFSSFNYNSNYAITKGLNGDFSIIPNKIVALADSINVLCKNFGLFVLTLDTDNKLFINPYYYWYSPLAVDMDLVINPNNNLHYIGMFSSDSKNFFVEFFMEKNIVPRLNKIIRSDNEIIFNGFQTNDQYLTYVLNELTNELIVIRRAMLNKLPYKTVIIDLNETLKKKDLKGNIFLTSIYNDKTDLNQLGIIIRNNDFSSSLDYNNDDVDNTFSEIEKRRLRRERRLSGDDNDKKNNDNGLFGYIKSLISMEEDHDHNNKENNDKKDRTKNISDCNGYGILKDIYDYINYRYQLFAYSNNNPHNNNHNNHIHKRSQINHNKNKRSLQTTNNYLFLLDDFKYGQDSIRCRFDEPGTFNVTVSRISEACPSSIQQNYAFAYCNIIHFVSIEAVGPDMTDLQLLGIILGSSLGFLALVFIVFFTVKTQCCTEFDFFTRPKRKIPSREELYRDNWTVNSKKLKERKYVTSSISDSNSNNSGNKKSIIRISNSDLKNLSQNKSSYFRSYDNNYINRVDQSEVAFPKIPDPIKNYNYIDDVKLEPKNEINKNK